MRILLVSSNFAPHVGGIERFTEILAAGLAGRGHQVTVVCCRSGGAPAREERDGYSVRRIGSSYVVDRRLNVPYPLPDPLDLVGTLRREVAGADVVHVQDVLYPTSYPALLMAHRRGVPSVLTQHVAFVPQSRPLLDGAQRVALATLGRCARLATVVASYNTAVAAWVEARWQVEDVRVLPVGVESPPAGPVDRAALRHSFGLPEERFLALFVGRDVPKKGLDIFLGARDPRYELVAVTDRRTPAPGVTLLPFVSPTRLQELMRCVDAFVLPSEGEGFPLSLQEALANGLPVVTTRHPGYEQYLGEDDVLFVERDSGSIRAAVARLTKDGELRRSLTERAQDLARRHFGPGDFVDAYATVYGEAVSGPRA